MAWVLNGSSVVGVGSTYTSADSVRPRAAAGGMPGYSVENTTALDMEQLLAVVLYERTQFEPDQGVAQRDLVLADQMNELLESGELEEILAESGLSIHDTLSAGATPADVAVYLEPARAALVEDEG